METELKKIMAQRKKVYITDKTRLPSAVLIPLYKKDGKYHIIFIKRTQKVKVHKGQISFPGGMRDKGDNTLLDTALREAEEEIGLHREDAIILGELDDEITTTSNYIVTPFIALIPWPYNLTPNKMEVAKIIGVPITSLLEKNSRKPDTETLNGKKVDSFVYYYQRTKIWGATARILKKLLEMIERINN